MGIEYRLPQQGLHPHGAPPGSNAAKAGEAIDGGEVNRESWHRLEEAPDSVLQLGVTYEAESFLSSAGIEPGIQR